MPDVGLIALAALAVVLVAAAILALRAIRAWRTCRSALRRLKAETEATMLRVEGVQERLELLGSNAAKLEEARAGLEASLATASLLLAATGDARAGLRWARWALRAR